MDEELKQYLQGMEDRTAALIAGEIGSLHTQIKQVEDRIVAQLDTIDARHADFARKLDELRGKAS
jgi:hypothetical protein